MYSFNRNYPSGNHDLLIAELGVSPDAKILDVGGGANPFKYADVVVDMDYDFGNIHRDGSALYIKKEGITYIQADIHSLPFKDKAFDFVFCIQVLEHVDSPSQACDELMRVAKAGFLETPRKWTEYYAGHPTHRWLIDLIDGYLTFEPVTYNESPFLNFALPVLWDSPELQKRAAINFSNIPSVQVVWGDNGFKYKVNKLISEEFKTQEFLAESHYYFAKNLLFWLGQFQAGAFHAERALKISPQKEKYQKLSLFYKVLTVRLRDIPQNWENNLKREYYNILPNRFILKMIIIGLLLRTFRFISTNIVNLFRKIISIQFKN
ncbi:MAG: class I SAM-dependent methyltransferase [Desulfamplus sp.]|nr:class I SAM-dependent methyltransferase [Desulfamplus sp.]